MSSKKITYSSDFKLKVLDYYFKQGGDDKFGLKKKTAGHFNIDKKTINRMLNNPDMVKRARKLLTARKTTGSAKTAPATRNPVKAAVRRAGATQSRPSSTSNKSASSSQNSASSSSNNKASTSSTSSTKAGNSSSRQQASNTTSSSNKTASPKPKPGISKPGIPKPRIPENKSSPGVEVFDLPEDPDYSLLKRSISAATNGVASLAKLLVTGTEEVRNVVLNECDVILECKVCRNLFRSIVNFLAHKRIYCQEEFADVRTLFYKGDVQGVTSQSNTIVVEPEPPPENENVNFMRTAIPTTHTSPMISVVEGRTRRSGIDSIALKLARKRKAYHASSSSTNTGSSSYFQSVSDVSSDRDKLSRDCSVVLEDIGGVKNAVFQTFVQPDSTLPSTSMSTLVEEASHSKSGMSVAINQNGDIVKTAAGDITSMEVDQPTISSESRDLTCLLCNTRFATQKTLSVHQRSHHGFERCIYACPICQASFLSMWAVVKHLQRTHKKTKNQIERLRKVVRKNVRKKMIYQKVDKNKTSEPLKNLDGEEEEEEDDNDDDDVQEEVETPSASPSKASEVASPKKSSALSSPMQTSPVKASSHKERMSITRRELIERYVKDGGSRNGSGTSMNNVIYRIIQEHQYVNKHKRSLRASDVKIFLSNFSRYWKNSRRRSRVLFKKYKEWLDGELLLFELDQSKANISSGDSTKGDNGGSQPCDTMNASPCTNDHVSTGQLENGDARALENGHKEEREIVNANEVENGDEEKWKNGGEGKLESNGEREFKNNGAESNIRTPFKIKRRTFMERYLHKINTGVKFCDVARSVIKEHQRIHSHMRTVSAFWMSNNSTAFRVRYQKAGCSQQTFLRLNKTWLNEDVLLKELDYKELYL